ncbi:MAG: NADPH-dependent F420 reductase [Acidimicrobiales bacterium]
MVVAILGATGPAGSALAARLASIGVDVVVGSRSVERAVETRDKICERWPGRRLAMEAADNATAAQADLVVIATPWDAAPATAASLADQLADKVVISMANAVARINGSLQPLLPARGSVAAEVQAAVPGARVAAAFHHLPARELGDLDVAMDADVLVCSDHPSAAEETAQLVGRIPGLRALIAGGLAHAGPVESFTAVLLSLNGRYRSRASLRISGIEP